MQRNIKETLYLSVTIFLFACLTSQKNKRQFSLICLGISHSFFNHANKNLELESSPKRIAQTLRLKITIIGVHSIHLTKHFIILLTIHQFYYASVAFENCQIKEKFWLNLKESN